MMVLEVISQKSAKIDRGEFFFITILNYEQKLSKKIAILAMQNHDKIYIAYFDIFQLI